ncbi:MAG: PaaI family thioesterase [Pseudomonadota bacterium]
MNLDPDLEWKVVDDKGFNTHVGPMLHARSDDTWYGSIQLSDHHINLGGVCHGAVYMALADVTMGIAALQLSEWRQCATIDFQAQFMAAAKKGQTLLCAAILNRAVGDLVFMQAEIWAEGRQCAHSSAIWKVLERA